MAWDPKTCNSDPYVLEVTSSCLTGLKACSTGGKPSQRPGFNQAEEPSASASTIGECNSYSSSKKLLFASARDHYGNKNWSTYWGQLIVRCPLHASTTQLLHLKCREDKMREEIIRARGSGCLLWYSFFSMDSTAMKSHQYGCLNKTGTRTRQADIPVWMDKMSKAPQQDQDLQVTNGCWER